MVALGILTPARAGERDDAVRDWEAQHDARLAEALDGTPEVAALYYRELLQNIEIEADPSRERLDAETLYWFARSLYALGDVNGALEALRLAVAEPTIRPLASALVAIIEADVRREGGLPVDFRFEDDTRSFDVAAGSTGNISHERLKEGGVLRWRSQVRAGEVSRLELPLRPSVPLHSLAFRVKAREFSADLQVTVQDGAGRRFAAPLVRVPTDDWLRVELAAASFRPLVGGGVMGRISSVQLENLTGYLSSERGAQELLVDDFRLD